LLFDDRKSDDRYSPTVFDARKKAPPPSTRPMPACLLRETDSPLTPDYEVAPMNLAFWIPLLFGLGLVALGLMFAFVIACDKV
jgi:hypothetical protein